LSSLLEKCGAPSLSHVVLTVLFVREFLSVQMASLVPLIRALVLMHMILLLLSALVGTTHARLHFRSLSTTGRSNRPSGPIISATSADPISLSLSPRLRSLIVSSLVATAAMTTAVPVFPNVAAHAADGSNSVPIVQGVIDCTDDEACRALPKSLLIQVYTAVLPDSNLKGDINPTEQQEIVNSNSKRILVAGAKLATSRDLDFPFRFQLFRQNLLVNADKFRDVYADKDFAIECSLCDSSIANGECVGNVIKRAVGISKTVRLPKVDPITNQVDPLAKEGGDIVRLYPYLRL
jgi:hypothetical protein